MDVRLVLETTKDSQGRLQHDAAARKKSGASGTFTTDLGGKVFTTTVKLSDL